MLWIAKTGAPWRELPERLGEWNLVFQRFNRWSKRGNWGSLFHIWQNPDLECLMLDSTARRRSQAGSGQATGAGRVAEKGGGPDDPGGSRVAVAVDLQEHA
ncbi:MAG: transposase [Phycisphaerales bacterium]|nr:transposase [Phycisphaerales bacterium]